MKIALVGSKGHGKDYVANILSKEYNLLKFAFADNIKLKTKEIYPFSECYDTHELKDAVIKDYNSSFRDLIFEVSKWYGEYHFFNENKAILEDKDNIIITDVRNKREYLYLEEKGYVIVYIERLDYPKFIGYDERIKEFYKDIQIRYINDFSKSNEEILKDFKEIL